MSDETSTTQPAWADDENYRAGLAAAFAKRGREAVEAVRNLRGFSPVPSFEHIHDALEAAFHHIAMGPTEEDHAAAARGLPAKSE